MNRIRYLIVLGCIFLSSVAIADEGMWLPLLLQKLNEREMKSLGMKINAKDIYSINSGSLKDAIVNLGGFCTGGIISSKGLLLTNHHCGFDAIQNHSTIEHNYIRDGYWAKNYNEELPNPGLYVTFIVKIEDVTKQALAGVGNSLTEVERQSQIDKNLDDLRKNFKKESYQDILIKPFFEANEYYLFVTETYRDVRLVGGPPAAIGNFGHDTDNWIWPRHTGDFSLFRIYASKDNKPAEYSRDNIPYKPKKSLSISIDGVSENDFTMVFGFPGRTTEYLPSVAVEQIIKVNDPAKISIREKILQVMDSFMRRDEKIKIQYATKYANVENAYKKWQGEILGLTRVDAMSKKKNYEAEFQKRINSDKTITGLSELLDNLNRLYKTFEPYGYARDYFNECFARIELFTICRHLDNLNKIREKNGEKTFTDSLPAVKEKLSDLYKEYDPRVDKKLFEVMMRKFTTDQNAEFLSPELLEMVKAANSDFSKLADDIYNSTDLDDGSATLSKLEKNPVELLQNHTTDKANNLLSKLNATYNTKVLKQLNDLQLEINKLQRQYMKAQITVFKEKRFYPDANSTMRVAYGKVKGYEARDGVAYAFYTYLDGVMEKYIPGDYEFDVPAKLQALYRGKDYGPYGVNGKMPVCFIATNHTTGGNSGSPALDGYGNLVGLNFDRAWEGTMSDINYDPSICRNIMVDIRYVLFIIDKYAGAKNLISEMKLVHPKKR